MPSDAPVRAFTPDEMEALRAEIREIVRTERLPGTAIARQSGVAYGTWSSWLGGTYAGDNDKIATATRRWLDSRSTAARTQALMPRAPDFVRTATAEMILATLEHAQHMPDLAVVTGGAGVGKTSAIEHYQGAAPNVFVVTASPMMATPRALLDELAEALGLGVRGLSSQQLSRAVEKRLRDTTALVVVDEAQHLTSLTLDQMRSIHDAAGVGVALVGNESVYARLEGGQRAAHFAQLFSRVGKRSKRPKPLPADVAAILDAWGVTEKPARALLRAIAEKPGALRGMTKALRLAHMLAAAKGEALAEAHIVAAWQDLTGDRAEAPAEVAA